MIGKELEAAFASSARAKVRRQMTQALKGEAAVPLVVPWLRKDATEVDVELCFGPLNLEGRERAGLACVARGERAGTPGRSGGNGAHPRSRSGNAAGPG